MHQTLKEITHTHILHYRCSFWLCMAISPPILCKQIFSIHPQTWISHVLSFFLKVFKVWYSATTISEIISEYHLTSSVSCRPSFEPPCKGACSLRNADDNKADCSLRREASCFVVCCAVQRYPEEFTSQLGKLFSEIVLWQKFFFSFFFLFSSSPSNMQSYRHGNNFSRDTQTVTRW